MTLRDTLGSHAQRVHDQVDKVLDGEDGIIVLIRPRQVTSYCLGFGLSGCQLELLAFQVERAIGAIAPARLTGNRRKGHHKQETDLHDGGDASPRCSDRRYRRSVADGRCEDVRSGGIDRSGRRGGAGGVLQLAGEVSASDPG